MSEEISTEEKVYNLTVELAEQKRLKKSAMEGFRDEIKRIEAEIKELIEVELHPEGAE